MVKLIIHKVKGIRPIKQQGYEEWDESCKITFHPGRHLRLHFAHSLYVEGCYKVYLVGGPALLWRVTVGQITPS